jgi:hypothetical protein
MFYFTVSVLWDLIGTRELRNKIANIKFNKLHQMQQYVTLFHNNARIKHPKYAQKIIFTQSSTNMMKKEASSNTIIAGSTSGDTTTRCSQSTISSPASVIHHSRSFIMG